MDLVNYSPPPPMVPCNESPPSPTPYKERIEQLSIYEFCTLLTIPPPPIATGGGGGIINKIQKKQGQFLITKLKKSKMVPEIFFSLNHKTTKYLLPNLKQKGFCKSFVTLTENLC